jgi:hypothetical protein
MNEMKEFRSEVNGVTNILLWQWVKVILIIAGVMGIISAMRTEAW